EELLPRKRVGDFNQALMEIGALVCTPKTPQCDKCPLASHCIARRKNAQNLIPTRGQSTETTDYREVAVLIRKGNKLLLVQRTTDANRWPGLWEFPHGEIEPVEQGNDAAIRIAQELAGIAIGTRREIGTINFSVTRFRYSMTLILAAYRSGRFHSPFHSRSLWLSPARMAEYPMSSPHRKLIAGLDAFIK